MPLKLDPKPIHKQALPSVEKPGAEQNSGSLVGRKVVTIAVLVGLGVASAAIAAAAIVAAVFGSYFVAVVFANIAFTMALTTLSAFYYFIQYERCVVQYDNCSSEMKNLMNDVESLREELQAIKNQNPQVVVEHKPQDQEVLPKTNGNKENEEIVQNIQRRDQQPHKIPQEKPKLKKEITEDPELAEQNILEDVGQDVRTRNKTTKKHPTTEIDQDLIEKTPVLSELDKSRKSRIPPRVNSDAEDVESDHEERKRLEKIKKKQEAEISNKKASKGQNKALMANKIENDELILEKSDEEVEVDNPNPKGTKVKDRILEIRRENEDKKKSNSLIATEKVLPEKPNASPPSSKSTPTHDEEKDKKLEEAQQKVSKSLPETPSVSKREKPMNSQSPKDWPGGPKNRVQVMKESADSFKLRKVPTNVDIEKVKVGDEVEQKIQPVSASRVETPKEEIVSTEVIN